MNKLPRSRPGLPLPLCKIVPFNPGPWVVSFCSQELLRFASPPLREATASSLMPTIGERSIQIQAWKEIATPGQNRRISSSWQYRPYGLRGCLRYTLAASWFLIMLSLEKIEVNNITHQYIDDNSSYSRSWEQRRSKKTSRKRAESLSAPVHSAGVGERAGNVCALRLSLLSTSWVRACKEPVVHNDAGANSRSGRGKIYMLPWQPRRNCFLLAALAVALVTICSGYIYGQFERGEISFCCERT
ncbi:unnamed protein product [Nezara viridula]|uniref:Uncharacterized protein n=1 Tax=Nezara viridula TaxID=85310 RepID=A0A9P0E4B8_NEZVI|nr:unnamed protein product [Nezara viridula]